MVTFFKTVLIIGCMFLIVPLAVWGGTGNIRHAWYALKRYLLVMAILVVPVSVLAGISFLVSLL